jgi:predicted transcriptional regulator
MAGRPIHSLPDVKASALESKRDTADIAARRFSGGSPVRVWREARGLSGKALAAATGRSAPCLSQNETGERDGSLAAMKKIADALHPSLDVLVAAKPET